MKTTLKGKFKIFLLIVFGILLVDQCTKYIVSKIVGLGNSVALIRGILYITYVKNTGAGFGIFKNQNTLLIFISLIVVGLILFYLNKILEYGLCFPFSLIFSGAIGNLIDRILFGYVRDFIDFRIWPTFNIADSCITIGIFLMLYYGLLKRKHNRKYPRDRDYRDSGKRDK